MRGETPGWAILAPMKRLGLAGLTILLAGCGAASAAPSPPTLRIGAIFPLGASSGPQPADELLGVTIARDMVNAGGGVSGRRIQLDVRDVNTTAAAQPAADSLRAHGVSAVIGGYSSELSIAASSAVARDGMVYWESGAVADRVTGRGLPLVFRVGADGAVLGGNSGRFVVQQLSPRLGRAPASLHVYLVTADDGYAHSVADDARATLASSGVSRFDESAYDPYAPYWPPILASIARAHPDVLVLSSHVPDGIAFRRAFLAARLHVDAFIGSTMAQCMSTFGDTLGRQAVGVFASDRPDDNFNPAGLLPDARALYDRFAQTWRQHTTTAPSIDGIDGFAAAWALFQHVLPRASGFDAASIAASARTLDVADGALPNGAGVRFAASGPRLGQNTRAAAVIWQWQAVGHSVVVWPPAFATGSIEMVPLPV